MKYLVDANVLSEPTKPAPAARVVDWLRRHDAELTVSPIILGELEYGILLLPSGRKRTRLLDWFSSGIRRINVIDLDAETARVWAMLLAELKRKGRAMSIKDSLIAATAKQHELAIATRNVGDYRHAGVSVVDPFKTS